MGKSMLAPHASVAGFAIFLVVYATQIWGGVFPFLPTDFQTQEVTLTFYLSQSLAFCASYVASAFGSYYMPSAARRMLVTLSISLTFIGSCFIIAVMYVPMFTLGFIVAGGAFLGVGCAGIFMLWQRYFSSISAPECNWRLIAGTAFGSLLYFMLYLIPNSLTAFLIPVVLLPICALCLSLSVREMDFDQSMFEDIPREHPQVYARMLHDFWRSAGGLGALAFAAGLARGVAIVEPDIQIAVNTTSMAGVLIACGFLIVAWRWFPFQFSLRSAFRAVYPIMFTGLLLFPFVQGAGLALFASVAYTVFFDYGARPHDAECPNRTRPRHKPCIRLCIFWSMRIRASSTRIHLRMDNARYRRNGCKENRNSFDARRVRTGHVTVFFGRHAFGTVKKRNAATR